MDSKNEFLSTLSHEIRTPLTSIKGFSKTILDSYDKLDDKQKKKFIKIIYEQSQRLINLVENALLAADTTKDSDNLVFKKADLNLILTKSLDLVKMNYPNMTYSLELQSELYSMADVDKLQQVFVNLLDNASKYSNNSKTVEIKTYQNEVSNCISIKNYGVYIEHEEFNKIFEKFTRLDNYLTSKTQGSGLGLYIVKMLVENMKGEISISSEMNPVSYVEFKVYFPIFKIEDFTKKEERKVV